MIYFIDVDKGCIVRKPDEGMHLEYIFNGADEWIQTEHDSSYEREYWLGEGNTCLFDITEEEALKIISSWNESLNEQQILSAKECYLFGDDTIYIAVDNNSDFFVYCIKDKSWRKRSNNIFWDSRDSAPYLFLPITNEEAVKKIYSAADISETTDFSMQSEAPKEAAKSETSPLKSNSNNIIAQMVDGIVGKESKNPTEREKEIRRNLSGRALEYLMFMDDE